LYSSVAPVTGAISPPKANAAVCVPVPPKAILPVFKLPGEVVQVAPLYSSVAVLVSGFNPPKANAAV
jgi:hypothetical protein